jgi:N-acetylmuramoyl-L-alanine amidase
VQRSDLTGFNWATVPSVLVEAGFLSNRTEDALLVTSAYQDKIAAGMTEGVMAYLATGN